MDFNVILYILLMTIVEMLSDIHDVLITGCISLVPGVACSG